MPTVIVNRPKAPEERAKNVEAFKKKVYGWLVRNEEYKVRKREREDGGDGENKPK